MSNSRSSMKLIMDIVIKTRRRMKEHGFRIVEFFNVHHPDPNDPDILSDVIDESLSDGMFRFEKKIR